MRVMRAEPSRFTDVAARSVGALWRAYDLQLTTYAALLATACRASRRSAPSAAWRWSVRGCRPGSRR